MHAAPALSSPQVCSSTGYPTVGQYPGSGSTDGRELPCRVEDPDLWFAERPADLETAKSFCADCPVRNACLTGALDRREPWGVWGGEIFEHGVVIARKRPRGRPRKEVAA